MSDWKPVEDSEWTVVDTNSSQQSEPSDSMAQDLQPSQSLTTGWKGVGQDVLQGLKDIPSSMLEMLKALPSEAKGMAKQMFVDPYQGFDPNLWKKDDQGQMQFTGDDPLRFGKNAATGIGNTVQGTLNLPNTIEDYLRNKEVLDPENPNILPKMQERDFAQMVGLEGQKPGDALSQTLTGMSPYLRLGEAFNLGKGGRMMARAGSQGAYAASQKENPVTAAGSIPAMELPLRAAGRGVNKLRPSEMLRGPLSIDELADNLRIADETNTPLGKILEHKGLNQTFENASTRVPFGGGDEALGQAQKQVETRGRNLMEDLGQASGQNDPNSMLKNLLDQAYNRQKSVKNDLYNPVSDMAQQEGLSLKMPKFSRLAQETLDTLKDSPLLQTEPEIRSAMQKMMGYQDPVKRTPSQILDPQGNPAAVYEQTPTISEAKMVAGALDAKASQLKKSPLGKDQSLGNLYERLAKLAREDVSDMINRGSPELQKQFKNAEQNYKDNYSPFLDREVFNLLSPDKEAEAIAREIIKPGKDADKASRIRKIQNLLPEQQRNTIGFAYLRSALDKEGKLDPKKMASLIKNLGPRQFEALFPDPNMRQQLLDFGKLRGMNEEALNLMVNPNTGQRAITPGMLYGTIGQAGAALSTGNPWLAGGVLFGPAAGARGFNKLMTSPGVRQKLVEKMMENQINSQAGRTPLADALSKSIPPSRAAQGEKNNKD